MRAARGSYLQHPLSAAVGAYLAVDAAAWKAASVGPVPLAPAGTGRRASSMVQGKRLSGSGWQHRAQPRQPGLPEAPVKTRVVRHQRRAAHQSARLPAITTARPAARRHTMAALLMPVKRLDERRNAHARVHQAHRTCPPALAPCTPSTTATSVARSPPARGDVGGFQSQ